MNVRTILLWGSIAVLTLLLSCQNPTGPESQITSIPTSVRGVVMRNDNLALIANALIYDIGGLAQDTSKSDGAFRLTYQLLSQTKTRIIGSRAGFGNDTASVTLNPGVDTTIVLRLRADSTSPSGAVSTGKAANIILISSGADNISIRGTGSNETALLLFEVRDSLGSPIAGVNKLKLSFSILGGPGGGEYVFPVAAETDPLTGRVTTRVSSGTKAGVLQIVATATVAGTPPITIKSSPIRVTISGGLPVEERFSLSRKPINIAGGVYDNLRAQIMVIVGDKEGNPVQPGTAISFSTTGGIIQPNALTDKDGIATVDLISGNPRPANSVALVTAKTIGDSGKAIQKQIAVLFSGATRVLPPPTSIIVVPDSGSTTFEYRVQDPNGFPLVGGTNITLSVDGPGSSELELSGDVTRSLEDSGDPTTTLFRATVRDKKLRGAAGAVTFKLSIVSQNGNVSATFPGLVLQDTNVVIPPPTASKSGRASSLTLVSISNPDVSVTGTGSNETARLTFAAKDSAGNPVELQKRAFVTFSISPAGGVGGGEFLYPVSDSTDPSGQVGTTFSSGTRSGVVQVVARTVVGGRTITSSPVRLTISQGLPDASHFTANLTPANIVSWPTIAGQQVATILVQVGDRFGNPVQQGTALSFSTTAGLITAKALTDDRGLASVNLFGGYPLPVGDSLQVSVQTVGEGGVSIVRTLVFRITSNTGSFKSGFASSLTVLSNETSQLAVRGTGAVEVSTLIFVAKDSAGNLLDERRRILVNFSISPSGGIGGGEFLSPTSGYTDAVGQVKTTFNSGIRSGVVQIVATASVLSQTISVASGPLTISGGFPDPTKVSATLSRVNMPGIAKSGPVGSLTVQVGDRFGNPVQPGTALSFSTTGGLVQSVAQTDASGLATVVMQGGFPTPNDPTLGPGYGIITLRTVGEGGTAISRPTPFLFSGAPRVTLQNVPTDTVRIFDASSFDIDYTVADINGNPVSGGHTVVVAVSGAGASGITLSGDVNVNTPDTQDKVNFTRYRFRAADNIINGGPSGELVFTITVNGESGSYVRKFYGVLQTPQVANTVPPTARQPSQIAFLGITNTDIYVAGVGNTENSVITYEVRDSLGIPIDKTRRVFATFGLEFYPNNNVGGGMPPQIIPSADSTDDSGKLRTAIVSGTQAGVVQIIARLQLPGGGQVASQPVRVSIHAGFADQRHFTITPSRWVTPGYDPLTAFPFFNQVQFTTVVADTFSNPVQQKTAVYYNSQAGVMQTGTTGDRSTYTDNTGISTSWLFTVNPKPIAPPFCDLAAGSGRQGYHWVYAQTQGRGGKWVIDSVLVVWNKAPIVLTGMPIATVQVPRALSSLPISITVKDINGNPLCDGTTITAIIDFTSDVSGIKFGVGGDLSSSRAFVMPNASYARFPGANITDFSFFVSDLSTNGGAPVGQSMIVTLEIVSPNLATRVVSFAAVIVP